ncbi:MAG: peptidylprolyl isomerase [Anaerolineae bacterium]|nr:peptidylprolyl isomerase [Anaerolineae bacterium]
MTHSVVEQDAVVTLLYRLKLDDGSLVEEATDDEPLVYLHGHENIIPGLEAALEGMTVGEQKKIVVEAADAYGEYDPDEVDEVSLSDLPPDFEPEVGMELALRDKDGNIYEASITEVNGDSVVLDFNPPLAGQRLHFEVTITDLRDATAEELEHGHVHDDEEVDEY